SGLPKLKIEEAAAKKQAKIDRGEDIIVGVNKNKVEKEEDIEILEVDNQKVMESQIRNLEKLRTSRDEAAVQSALDNLTLYAKTGKGNALDLSIKAARVRCSVGEITYALERVWGRYNANNQTIAGVYGSAYVNDEEWQKIKSDIEEFEKLYGRRPRMIVAKMGQDGHDRGAKVIATAFADVGFDIDIAPLFSTPQEVAKQAIENDVHVVGISSQAAGHKTLIPQLIEELKNQGSEDIIVIAGGVIPKRDYETLYQCGVKGIFGPGTPIPEAAKEVLKSIKNNLVKK
ncbi:methylmalonyl-CoA mutase family protein, partial [Bacteriovoracales bacterium]|nr:methylmalonyl-CoA mutase family protein [Bacteriovoracales bacterium]